MHDVILDVRTDNIRFQERLPVLARNLHAATASCLILVRTGLPSLPMAERVAQDRVIWGCHTGLMVKERNWLEVYPYTKWGGNSNLPTLQVGQTFFPTELLLKEVITPVCKSGYP